MKVINKFSLLTIVLVMLNPVSNANGIKCLDLSENITGVYDVVDGIGCGYPDDFAGKKHRLLCADQLSKISQPLLDYKNNCNSIKDEKFNNTMAIINKLTNLKKSYNSNKN